MSFNLRNLGLVNLDKFDFINRLIPLSVVPLTSVHCNTILCSCCRCSFGRRCCCSCCRRCRRCCDRRIYIFLLVTCNDPQSRQGNKIEGRLKNVTKKSIVQKTFRENGSPQNVESQSLKKPDRSGSSERKEEAESNSNRHPVYRVPGGRHHGRGDGVRAHEFVQEFPGFFLIDLSSVK
jgi:hypothetical protein